MAIHGYTKDQFGTKLGLVVSASRPIHTFQRLKGREEDLIEIEKALYAPGRHVFIYGDRGVGKSSLGATAAFIYQSSDATPLFVSGSVDDTFKSVIGNIVYQALGRARTASVKSTRNVGLEWRGIKLGGGTEVTWPDIAGLIHAVGDAAELLKEVTAIHSAKPVVVIDEFDTIGQSDERGKFASLLKLDELLGAHQSAHRQLLTHELPKLGWDGRRDIVSMAVEEFGLSINNDVSWRVAAVSDGYPYYVHLITEHMLWAAFQDKETVSEVGWDHYHNGLRAAVQSINAELRKPYEKAVLHREAEFEDVVWSTADAEDLFRSLGDMYASYKIITSKRPSHIAVDRERYSHLLRKLKLPSHGTLLQPEATRAGWYSYREKMLRGYVRMQAEANGIPLNGEREAPRQHIHVSNARHGYRGPSLPSGVRETSIIDDLRKKERQ
jgi:energy-coupling factor transporter ATP-binding protein EcfA2